MRAVRIVLLVVLSGALEPGDSEPGTWVAKHGDKDAGIHFPCGFAGSVHLQLSWASLHVPLNLSGFRSRAELLAAIESLAHRTCVNRPAVDAASCFRETNGALHAAIASHCTRAGPDALRVASMGAVESPDEETNSGVFLSLSAPARGARVTSPVAFTFDIILADAGFGADLMRRNVSHCRVCYAVSDRTGCLTTETHAEPVSLPEGNHTIKAWIEHDHRGTLARCEVNFVVVDRGSRCRAAMCVTGQWRTFADARVRAAMRDVLVRGLAGESTWIEGVRPRPAHLVASGVKSMSQSWLHGCGLDGEVSERAAPAAVLQATWLAILAGLEEHRDVFA